MPARSPPLGPLRARVLASRTAARSCFGLREQVRAAAAWRTPASRPGGGRAGARGGAHLSERPHCPGLPHSRFPASPLTAESLPPPQSTPAIVPSPVCSGDDSARAVSGVNLSTVSVLTFAGEVSVNYRPASTPPPILSKGVLA